MSDLLFFAGGECLTRHGTLVWRQSQAQDNASTFTRSGTTAQYTGGSERLVAYTDANTERVTWNDETPALLIEQAHVNLLTASNDDVTNWSDNQGSGTTIGSVADPAGGTAAYSITGASGSGSRGRNIGLNSFTGDGIKSAVFVIKERTMPSSGNQAFGIKASSGGAAWHLYFDITGWVNGKPTITATTGTHLGSRYIGNGFWAVYGNTTSVTASESHRAYVYSNEDDNSNSPAIDVYRMNAYNDLTPRYSLLDANITATVETFYADFVAPPQAMTVYAKVMGDAGLDESASTSGGNNGLVHIGSTGASTDPRLSLYSTVGTNFVFMHDNGTNERSSTISSSAAVWGDTVELRGVLNADGSVVLGQSINAGAETTGSTSSTSAVDADAWAADRIYIGSLGTANQGVAVVYAVKVARGVQTMAQMRAL
tara:strand:+ start:1353 stop:2633 length:1281 start_codon:yes stop_codon:yes gene_type:complete